MGLDQRALRCAILDPRPESTYECCHVIINDGGVLRTAYQGPVRYAICGILSPERWV